MKLVCGIISYLPPKWGIRKDRLVRLHSLIDAVKFYFNVPVLVIAQNYKDEEYSQLTGYHDNVVALRYDKPLGITGAREELRKQFLSTDYDVIILLDDDCELRGKTGLFYLKEIEDNPGKLYLHSKSLHKLLAVHRDVYKLQAYDLENTPENHKAYEDRLFVWTLVGTHPELVYRFKNPGVGDASIANFDKTSSWSQSITPSLMKEMSDRTDKLIEERTGKDIESVYRIAGYSHNH